MQLSMFTLCISWLLLNICCSTTDLTNSQQQSQFKRKRLMENYSTKTVKTPICTQSAGYKCQACSTPRSTAKYIISPNDPKEKLRACKKCFDNSMRPQREERVLISDPGDRFSVAKILDISDNDMYDVQFIEGPNAGSHITINENGFTKLVHDIIPSEKLCPICDYFMFQEQKCDRNKCDKGICYSCYKKVPQCEYCKLLHRGTPVKVKQKNLSQPMEISLQKQFGDKFTEVYGYIVNYYYNSLLGGNIITYKVELWNDYEWKIDANGQMWFILPVNTDNPMITYLLEREVEVLRPPAEEEFDFSQFSSVAATIDEEEEHEEVNNDVENTETQFAATTTTVDREEERVEVDNDGENAETQFFFAPNTYQEGGVTQENYTRYHEVDEQAYVQHNDQLNIHDEEQVNRTAVTQHNEVRHDHDGDGSDNRSPVRRVGQTIDYRYGYLDSDDDVVTF